MIDPGSMGDWLQASLMAAALGGLAAAGRWALRNDEADPATPQAVPLRVSTGTMAPAPQSPRQLGPLPDEYGETYRPSPPDPGIPAASG